MARWTALKRACLRICCNARMLHFIMSCMYKMSCPSRSACRITNSAGSILWDFLLVLLYYCSLVGIYNEFCSRIILSCVARAGAMSGRGPPSPRPLSPRSTSRRYEAWLGSMSGRGSPSPSRVPVESWPGLMSLCVRGCRRACRMRPKLTNSARF